MFDLSEENQQLLDKMRSNFENQVYSFFALNQGIDYNALVNVQVSGEYNKLNKKYYVKESKNNFTIVERDLNLTVYSNIK